MAEKSFKDFFKDYLRSNIKELTRFTIMGVTVFLVMVASLAYLLVRIFEIDIFISAIIISITTAATIVYIDEKKIHAHRKILENNKEILKRLLKR